MFSDKDDEASVKGQGPDILLPARGNPFGEEGEAPAAPEAVYGIGAEIAAEIDAEAALAAESPPPAPAAPAAMPEPQDLTPEDFAALFPSSHTDREADDLEDLGSEALSEADLTSATTLGIDRDLPGHPAPSMAEEEAAMFPTAHADRDFGADFGLPETAAPSAPGAAGTPVPGLEAFAGASLQISEDVGVQAVPYRRGEALVGRKELVDMFVSDGRLVTLWTEIEAVEANVTSKVGGLSRAIAEELLDRLAKARNYLMNDRANFEEAQREVAEVKYRLARVLAAGPAQQPRVILVYLLVMLGLIVSGFRLTGSLAQVMGETLAGARLDLVWNTLLWGGIGGVTGALYGLWTHVAQKQDYDPQYAMWYYTNPLMGLILGAFSYVILRAGTLTVIAGAQAEAAEISPFILYVFGWAVGFQQNLAFSLVDALLKKLIPASGKSSGDAAKATK